MTGGGKKNPDLVTSGVRGSVGTGERGHGGGARWEPPETTALAGTASGEKGIILGSVDESMKSSKARLPTELKAGKSPLVTTPEKREKGEEETNGGTRLSLP